MSNLEEIESVWYERIAQYSNGLWHCAFTFKGTRFRDSLKTRDRDEAAVQVRDKWTILEHKTRQSEFLRAGVIQPDQVKRREQMTLAAACERFMTEHGHNLPSNKSLIGYQRVLLAELGAETLLSDIDTPLVAKMVRVLEKENVKYKDGARPLAEGTINHHTRHLRALLRRARRSWGIDCDYEAIIWSSDEGGVLLTEPDFQRETITNEEQVEKIISAMRPDTRPVFEFALELGVRAANAFTLRKSQVTWNEAIDMETGSIAFAVKSKKRNRRTGQSGKNKPYPITPRVAELLRAAWGDHAEFVFTYLCDRNRNWADKDTGERVNQRKGQRYPFTKSLLRDRWDEARAKSGMTLRWHDATRASFATRLHEDGVDIVDIKEAMGHADLSTTMRYINVSEERTRSIIEDSSRRRVERKKMAASRLGHDKTAGHLKVVK